MKKFAALLLVSIAAGNFCGCAALAQKEPGKGYKDPNATTGVFHDYDYGWNGNVGPYTPARLR